MHADLDILDARVGEPLPLHALPVLAIEVREAGSNSTGCGRKVCERVCSAAGSALMLLRPPPSAVHGHSVRACTGSVGQRLPVDARAECLPCPQCRCGGAMKRTVQQILFNPFPINSIAYV